MALRFAVEAREAIREHLAALFASEPATPEQTEETHGGSAVLEPISPEEASPGPFPLPTSLSQTRRDDLAADNAARHDWIAEEGRPQREVHGTYQRTADLRISTTDPDATPMRLKGGGTHLGYHTHYVVDGGRSRIILSVLVVPGEVNDNQPILDLIWRILFRWRLRPRQVTGDMMYGTIEIIKALEDAHIRAYIPVAERGQRAGYYGLAQFTYDAFHDQFTCPQGHILRPAYRLEGSQEVQYRADAAICNACPVKSACTESNRGRHVHHPFLADYLDRVKAYEAIFAYQKALNKRKVWVEPLFGEGKQWHGMRRFRLRRLWRVNCEALVIASGQNLKRLLQKRGWGRRPFPSEAVAMALPLASPIEKPPTNRSKTIHRRKVAVAEMISLGLNNRQSYAYILCFSLNSHFMTIFLILSSSPISLLPSFLLYQIEMGNFLAHPFS
ncbi:hypothetical protein EPA93_15265 [Ktedonosporobacter rubrisoli]|uniref:Transposase DDE domain-containing protein n=1 Tax=Ktedonosporobacter rubrisoli TaxID=2509675 RepID=A0A4P6JPH5_KTERU|nr:transposase [Ktedonosporobacter rubrisoli]QBD77277.1 hypothetical protein EPA93_15265 [Ktedonosporobacter rubrisoli]